MYSNCIHSLFCAAGHLTYECRNFIKLDKQNIHLVSSISSEEESKEDNEVSVSSTSSPSSSEDDRKRS